MSGTVLVVLVLAAVMAAIMAVSLVVLHRVGGAAERRADELRAEVEAAGEEWLVPLAGAVYQGGGSPHARSRGRGVLGLTGRRLVFLPIAGERVSVPRVRVTGVRAEERRRDAAAAHRHLLMVRLDDDTELGFLVDEPEKWLAALGASDGAADA